MASVDSIISAIYDAALHEDLWNEAAEAICAACGARRGLIAQHHVSGTELTVLGHCGWPNPSERLPAAPQVEGEVITIQEGGGGGRRPQYFVAAGIQQRPRRSASLLVELETALDATTRALLGTVLPHLKRALQIGQRSEATRQEVLALRLALNSAPMPVFIIDTDGAIRSRNEAGADLLRHGPALLVSGGRIQARRRTENEALQRSIAAAAAWVRGEAATAPDLLHLRSREGYPALSLMFASLPPETREIDPVIILLVSDLVSARPLNPELLTRQFSFTPAESEVAARVAEGVSLSDIAAQTGTSLGTVRVHLKRLLTKTGTHSQAQLVSMLWHSLGTFRAEFPSAQGGRQRRPGRGRGNALRLSEPQSLPH